MCRLIHASQKEGLSIRKKREGLPLQSGGAKRVKSVPEKGSLVSNSKAGPEDGCNQIALQTPVKLSKNTMKLNKSYTCYDVNKKKNQ